jgi:hypothetical protein
MKEQLWFYFKLNCMEAVLAYYEPLRWLYRKLRWESWD